VSAFGQYLAFGRFRYQRPVMFDQGGGISFSASQKQEIKIVGK